MQMNGSDMLKYSSPGYIQASLLSRGQGIDARTGQIGKLLRCHLAGRSGSSAESDRCRR